jgi:hypothetical protein
MEFASQNVAVAAIMQEIRFIDRELIYGVGDLADAIFSVISGFVILRKPNLGGASREHLMGPGAVFGAAEVLAGTVRSTTASAHGDTVVASHLPAAIVNEMVERPEAADAMVASLLSTITRDNTADIGGIEKIGPNSVCLIPTNQAVIDQMGQVPLTIDHFPFVIGRKSENNDPDIDGPLEGPEALILEDRRPFHLSRRHLAIEREDGLFVVRDYRSFHGTIVNGIPLAVGGSGLKMPLEPGENRIIAGNSVSPFQFTCIVPTLPGT